MAWPTDSWICSAICSLPSTSVVSPLGHAGAREQLPGLLGDARRVGVEVDLVDELPAPRAVLAARRRVRPALRLAVADRRGHDPGAALPDVLVDAVTVARHEPLRRVPDLVQALGDVGAVLAHRGRGADQQVALVGERHGRAGRSRTRSTTSRSPPAPAPARRAPRATSALAAAISRRLGAGGAAAASDRSAVAQKPHPEPTRARTPMPASSSWVSCSTSPLRAVIDS